MQATKIDLLIHCRWIIPIVPENQILENCSVAVDGEKISGIYPQPEATKLFEAVKTETFDNHVLMPGLVNAHGPSARRCLRGYADALDLTAWLANPMWPA